LTALVRHCGGDSVVERGRRGRNRAVRALAALLRSYQAPPQGPAAPPRSSRSKTPGPALGESPCAQPAGHARRSPSRFRRPGAAPTGRMSPPAPPVGAGSRRGSGRRRVQRSALELAARGSGALLRARPEHAALGRRVALDRLEGVWDQVAPSLDLRPRVVDPIARVGRGRWTARPGRGRAGRRQRRSRRAPTT